jgi:hypothetical protein
MRRLGIIIAVIALLTAPGLVSVASGQTGRPAAVAVPLPLARFGGFGGSHFGGSHFGGGLFSRHRSSFGSRRSGSGRGLLHRVARALAFAYIFHLLFSHGGFSILLWIVIIALVVHLVRRRRRRYAY